MKKLENMMMLFEIKFTKRELMIIFSTKKHVILMLSFVICADAYVEFKMTLCIHSSVLEN